MTLKEIYNVIGNIALSKVEVNSYHTTNPYTAFNQPDIKYSAVAVEFSGCRINDNIKTYNGVLYFSNRLVENGENNFLIQEVATNTIVDIIKDMEQTEGIVNVSIGDITFFNQKFVDYLSGAYCNIDVSVLINDCNRMN